MIHHKHFHILLFFVASSSSSLPRAIVAQSATQPIAARSLQGSVNPSIAVVAVVLVLVVLVTGFCSIYLRQCSETYVVAGNRIGAGDCSRSPQGIKPEVLATFPMLVYSAMKDLKVGKCAQQCAVCLGEFGDCETLRLLPKCSHVFHPDCIDAWLAFHVTCPVCRAKLKPDCTEVRVVIGDSTNAHQVFDESSVRSAEVGAIEQQDHQQQQQEVEMNGSSKVRTFGMLVRSHSTGHSLVEPGKNLERERYNPSSPEEARKQILDEHGSMKRSVSYSVILQSEGCSGKGWWSRGEGEGEGSSKGSKKDGVERQNRWVLSVTPPFVVSCGWGSSGCASSTTCSGIPRFWASSSHPLLPL